MTWLQRYRVRDYLRSSLWIWPLLSMTAALGTVWLLHGVEERLGWHSELPAGTAQAVLGTLASSMFTFMVFVCSTLLVAVQLASQPEGRDPSFVTGADVSRFQRSTVPGKPVQADGAGDGPIVRVARGNNVTAVAVGGKH